MEKAKLVKLIRDVLCDRHDNFNDNTGREAVEQFGVNDYFEETIGIIYTIFEAEHQKIIREMIQYLREHNLSMTVPHMDGSIEEHGIHLNQESWQALKAMYLEDK